MPSIVYFTKDISPSGLIRIYEALGAALPSKVAVKISTGEPPGDHWLHPELIGDLVKKVSGTIVECNTAYEGARHESRSHWKVMKDHGFTEIAPCDILDEEGDMSIPIVGGKMIKTNYVGTHLDRYQSILMLSHFKGHQMAGMGGALKNMSIGLASAYGKVHIHNYGTSDIPDDMFKVRKEGFIDAMADACKGIIDHFGRSNLCYINVMNNVSIDCDCNSHPKPPAIGDVGIFGSTDPVAVDTACARAIYASKENGKADLIKRISERNGLRILDSAQALGLGSKTYAIREI